MDRLDATMRPRRMGRVASAEKEQVSENAVRASGVSRCSIVNSISADNRSNQFLAQVWTAVIVAEEGQSLFKLQRKFIPLKMFAPRDMRGGRRNVASTHAL